MRTNFQFENQNITMVRGDTVAFNVEIYDEEDQPVTVDTAYLTCRKATNSGTIFQKDLGHGISQQSGLMSVRIAPEDTRDVEEGRYFYDFQIGVGEDVYTIMIGMLSIEQDVS